MENVSLRLKQSGPNRTHTAPRPLLITTTAQLRLAATNRVGLLAFRSNLIKLTKISRPRMEKGFRTSLLNHGLMDCGQLNTLGRASGKAKQTSTLTIDEGRIERHIKPLLGAYAVAAVTRRDVERFLHEVAEGKTKARVKTKARGLARVRGGKTAANRSTGLLGAIFTYAVRQGMRPDNPVHGLQRFADGKRDRRLSDHEYGLLGVAVARAADDAIWPPAVAVVRFLALTGWRKGEALELRWSEIDLSHRTATLSDTKTGRSVRPLSQRACEVLQEMAALYPNGNGLVFPATPQGNTGVTRV